MVGHSKLSKTLQRKNYYAYQLFKALVTQVNGRLLLQFVPPYYSCASDIYTGSRLGVDTILHGEPLWQRFFSIAMVNLVKNTRIK